jgi:pimeloyl-ACP methyl ester carboxylesterase
MTSGTVVFIHGFLDTAALWNGVHTRMRAPGWRVRAVNLRHVDQAEPGRRGAILEGYRDQVLKDLDGPVVVVGHSMGAQIAELVAAALPDTAVGLALIVPIPLAGYPLAPESAADFDRVARERDPAAAAVGRKALLVNDSEPVVRALVRATLATPPDTAVQELAAWTVGHPGGDHPATVDVPVLVIGSEDGFTSTEAVVHRFTDVRTSHVAGAGHWPHVEQPAAVAEILTNYLERLGT